MSDTSFWDVILWMFWFMLLVAWITLFFRLIGDIFSDHELSGWGKALWMLFLIFMPWIGVLVYLIVRGKSMQERAIARAQEHDAAFRSYVQDAAGTAGSSGMANQLRYLAKLRDDGVITAADYDTAKAKVLAS